MQRAVILRQKLSLLTSLDECAIQDSKVLRKKFGVLKEIALILAEEVELLSQIEAPDLSRGIDLSAELPRFESQLIQSALKKTSGHQTRAAKLLGIKATTLSTKLRKLNISVEALLQPSFTPTS